MQYAYVYTFVMNLSPGQYPHNIIILDRKLIGSNFHADGNARVNSLLTFQSQIMFVHRLYIFTWFYHIFKSNRQL